MWCLAIFRNVHSTSSVSTKRNITNQWHLIKECCNAEDLAPKIFLLKLGKVIFSGGLELSMVHSADFFFLIISLIQTCPCRHLIFVLVLFLSKLLISSCSRKQNAMEINFCIQKFYLFLDQTFYCHKSCQSGTGPHPNESCLTSFNFVVYLVSF